MKFNKLGVSSYIKRFDKHNNWKNGNKESTIVTHEICITEICLYWLKTKEKLEKNDNKLKSGWKTVQIFLTILINI